MLTIRQVPEQNPFGVSEEFALTDNIQALCRHLSLSEEEV